MKPVHRTAGIAVVELVPGANLKFTSLSTCTCKGVPLKAGSEKYSPFSPALPSGVDSADAGTGAYSTRKLVPGANDTCEVENCLRIPSSAVVEREGVPL